MKKILLALFILVFLFNSVFALDIDSCRTLNQSNTNYVLTKDVSSAGTCFTVDYGASGSTLDLAGHTINYAQSETGRGVSIKGGSAPYNVNGFTIKNGQIKGGYQDYAHGIRGSNAVNLQIYDLNMFVQGLETHGIFVEVVTGYTVHDVNLTMNSVKTNPCWHVDQVHGISGGTGVGGKIAIYNNRVTGKGMVGINISDCASWNPNQPAEIYNNYVSLWSPVRDGYAISVQGKGNPCSDGTKIYNNTIDQVNGRGAL